MSGSRIPRNVQLVGVENLCSISLSLLFIDFPLGRTIDMEIFPPEGWTINQRRMAVALTLYSTTYGSDLPYHGLFTVPVIGRL